MKSRTQDFKASAPAFMRAEIPGVVLGLLMAAFSLVDLYLRPPFHAISINSEDVSRITPAIVTQAHILVNIAFAVPIFFGALKYGLDLTRAKLFFFVSFGVIASVILSLIGVADLRLISLVVILMLNFVLAGIFASTSYEGSQGLSGLFKGFAIGGGAVLLATLQVGEFHWGRLVSHAGPNWWGALAFLVIVSAISLRNNVVKALLIALGLLIMVLTSSRGAMMALIAGGLVALVLSARRAQGRKGLAWIGVLVILTIPLIIVGPWLADSLFHFSDPTRGIHSGGTGRSYGWRDAWRLFEQHPIFGIGFRRHEQFMTRTSTAHQAYLAVMAETGVVGIAAYLTLVLGAMVRLLLRAGSGNSLVWDAAAAFMAGFLVIGFVETSSLTMGVPSCLLMVFITAYAWRGVAIMGPAPARHPPARTRIQYSS